MPSSLEFPYSIRYNEVGGCMKMIDFMTKTEYMPSNQEKQDIKMALILPDGTISLAGKSHDDKPMRNYGVTGPRKTVEVHVDYVRILCEHFFRDDQELLEYANQENFYAVIMHWIQQGIVLFNNSTTYEGPAWKTRAITHSR